jgi:multidrug transporter EmrE-like cation transporter
MLNFIVIVAYVALTSFGLIAIKIGTGENQQAWHLSDKIAIPLNIPMTLGILLYISSFLVYIFLISKFELSYIIPVASALVYVVVFTAAFLFFKEQFTLLKLIAIVFIIVGVMLLNTKAK